MSKSLNARYIHRWTVELKGRCNSKHSLYWRKHHLRSYIQECALTITYCMAERMAEDNTMIDFQGTSREWSPEFSAWYHERREQHLRRARDFLDKDATDDGVDEEIQDELEAWSD